jgi:hypothetical protein
MVVHTYRVTVNGKAFTRRSHRLYTHAVVFTFDRIGREPHAAAWCGSHALAIKKAAELGRSGALSVVLSDGVTAETDLFAQES